MKAKWTVIAALTSVMLFSVQANAEEKALEQQTNNLALARQKTLQGMLQDVLPRYRQFERQYQTFNQKGIAPEALQAEATALKQAVEAMEKAATNGAPDIGVIEANINANLSDRVMEAISNCCIRVFRGIADDTPLSANYQSLGWNFGYNSVKDPANITNAVKFVFNCTEKTLLGKPVTKIDYSWKGSKQMTVSASGEKEISAYEFVVWYNNDSAKQFPGGRPRLGLWVYGNGSGDKLMRNLPVDWKGWRHVELNCSDLESYSDNKLVVFEVARADQTEEREPLYFGPGILYGEVGQLPMESPASPYPFPFYLAENEALSIPINNGLYDVEIGLDKRVTDGRIPEIFINDVVANEKSSAAVVNCRCEVKDGFICLRSVCRDHRFSGIKHIKISRQNQTVAYCDAAILKQTQKFIEINDKPCYYTFNDPISLLETNTALFEQELGGKQLAAYPRIVYQFKLDPGEYRVRLRFNRWRGTYPETAKFDVFLQAQKVMAIREPNKELLFKDFKATVTNGYLQVALLGAVQDAYAWLGDISIFKGDRLVGFVQPRPSIPEKMNGDYYGLRNLAPNPSFEIEAWQRNWVSISPTSKPVRTNFTAHQGNWSMCLERTVGPAGLIVNNNSAEAVIGKIKEGKITAVSKDERFNVSSCFGTPIDYTKPYRFMAWVKTEQATGQTYLQIVWVAAPRRTLDEKPLIPESPKYRKIGTYFTILGVSESAKVSGSQDWQKLVLDAKPPYGATHAVFVLRSDDNQGKVYFDDLDFDGFGSDPVEIVLPQIGYHPAGKKTALIKTREPVKEGRFQLNNSNGKTVSSGKLEPVGIDAWGIYLSQADFSKYETEGRYTLKVAVGDQPERTTPSFVISPNLYRDLGMLSITGYFHIERCGFEVPGWHPACHLDDAAIRNDYACGKQPEYLNTNKPKGEIIKHVDLTGGWHDAGSLDKYGEIMDEEVINMCQFWEDTHYVSGQLKEKYPDVLSEANWGLDYTVRSINRENNKIYGSPIEWNPITKDYICLGSDPTDNIKNTADDRVCRDAQGLNAGRNNIIPVALTRFACNLREYDQTRAKELLETAAMWNASNNLALAMARYAANGKQKEDLIVVESQIERILSSYLSARYPYILADYAEVGNIVLLFDFFDLCPDSKLLADMKSMVRRICDEIIKPLAENNAYGVVDQMGEPVMTRAFSPAPSFHNVMMGVYPGKYLQIAYFLARSGRLLKDPELVRLGERHIQYVLGRNPHGLSMVGGVGYKVYSIATLLFPYGSKWIELKGQIPGSVGSLYAISDGSRNWISSLGPLDFPVPQTASELVDTYAGCGEVWEFPTGWFIAACGALDRALREMDNK